MRFRTLVVCLGTAMIAAPALAQAPAAGQPRPQQPPPAPKNLQVLPKDISRQELLARMQAFSQALGVRCNYCHVDDDPGRANDLASDEKAPKNKARAMMRLTADLNAKVPEAVNKPAGDATRVQCITCHRGVAIPKQLADILTATAADKGVPAAIDQFRELRKQYYGAQAYDFSDNGVIMIAQRQMQAQKPDDALAFLALNTEFYPNWARTYVVMAQAYNAKKDRESAIKNLEKALSIDANNGQAKRMLDMLKNTSQH